jgi:hypothetical protein
VKRPTGASNAENVASEALDASIVATAISEGTPQR